MGQPELTGGGQQRLETLHGLRGLAALMVVLFHLIPIAFTRSWIGSGYLAVDLFFVLSGVVIARAYDGRLTGGLPPREFILLRLIRLYPLFVAGMVLSVLSAAIGHLAHFDAPSIRLTLLSFALSLFFLPTPLGLSPLGAAVGWARSLLYPLNGPAWSLLLELIGNTLFALLHRHLSRWLLAAVIGVGALALAVAAYHGGNLQKGASFGHFGAALARIVFSFFAGVAIGRATKRLPVQVSSAAVTMLYAVAGLLLVLDPAPHLRWAYDLLVVTLAWPLVVIAAIRLNPGPLLRTVSHHAGEWSYACYSLHMPFLFVLIRLSYALTGRGWHEQTWTFVAIYLVATVALAAVASERFDRPARAWLRRRLGEPRVREGVTQF